MRRLDPAYPAVGEDDRKQTNDNLHFYGRTAGHGQPLDYVYTWSRLCLGCAL